MPAGGRPSKLSPVVIDRILKAVRHGCLLETAAAFAGIHRVTLYRWIRRAAAAGAGPEARICNTFKEKLAEAMAESEIRDVEVIRKAAEGGYPLSIITETTDAEGNVTRVVEHVPRPNWRAAAWRLQRRFPSRWGRRTRHEHSGPAVGPVPGVITFVEITAPQETP